MAKLLAMMMLLGPLLLLTSLLLRRLVPVASAVADGSVIVPKSYEINCPNGHVRTESYLGQERLHNF